MNWIVCEAPTSRGLISKGRYGSKEAFKDLDILAHAGRAYSNIISVSFSFYNNNSMEVNKNIFK